MGRRSIKEEARVWVSWCFFQEGSFYVGKNVQQSKQWVSASFDQSSREKTKQKLKRRWIFIKTIEGWEQLVCNRVSSSLIELTYCCQSGIGIFVIFWQINFKNKIDFQDPSESWFKKGKSFPFVNLINWLFMFGQYKRFCVSSSVLLLPFAPCKIWLLREDINRKKTFSFGHCPNERGVYPCPDFWPPFFAK